MNRCELWAWKLFGSLPDPISSVGTERHVSCPTFYVFRVAWELEARASKISLLCFDSVLFCSKDHGPLMSLPFCN